MSSLQVITATAKEWIAALNRLAPATSGNKPVPILYMVLVSPSAGTLRAVGKGVDAETGIDALGEGKPFLVSYVWLKDAITSITGRRGTELVTVTAKGNEVTVEACGYKLHVETMPAADFPNKPSYEEFTSHSAVDAIEMRDALGRALLAASKDDTLPILNSVRITSAPEGLRLWSTDRYRLVSDLVVGPGSGNESFTVPAGPLKHMAKLFKAGSVHVDSVKGGPVIFSMDETSYAITPVDGKYPDLATLFPSKSETVIDVDRVQLLEAAKVAERMAERNTPAFLDMTKDGVQVSFNGGLFGPDLAPLVSGGLAGEPMAIALNARFFLEAMTTFKADRVRIHGTHPNKAFTFIDGGAALTDDTIYRHMLMTVRMPEQDGNRG